MSIESSVSRQKANTSLVNEFDCGGVINKVPKYRWNLVCDVLVLYYKCMLPAISPVHRVACTIHAYHTVDLYSLQHNNCLTMQIPQ